MFDRTGAVNRQRRSLRIARSGRAFDARIEIEMRGRSEDIEGEDVADPIGCRELSWRYQHAHCPPSAGACAQTLDRID